MAADRTETVAALRASCGNGAIEVLAQPSRPNPP
jgi:hypothetical protein